MNEINLETRLAHLKRDYCGTRIRQAQFRYSPDWRWEYVGLLKVGEYGKAAELRNEQERLKWQN